MHHFFLVYFFSLRDGESWLFLRPSFCGTVLVIIYADWFPEKREHHKLLVQIKLLDLKQPSSCLVDSNALFWFALTSASSTSFLSITFYL